MKSLILALALLGVSIHPVNAAAVEGSVIFTMNSTRYCVGASWNLKLSNAPPNAAIRLFGVVNETPWEIPHWADTDANGNFSASGTYAVDAAARYTLSAEIGGSTSNILPVEVLNCGWRNTGSLNIPAGGPMAMLLNNGKVLAMNWVPGSGVDMEWYAPATGTWRVAGKFNTARFGYTATLLANGTVLVAGGVGGSPIEALSSAELYDPATETWSVTGNLNAARSAHTATLLPNGQVLVAGGIAAGGIEPTELYDPATGTWSLTASIPNRVYSSNTATLLANGNVLLVGGGDYSEGYPTWTGAALYDPAAEKWRTIDTPNKPRESHTATLLSDGRVLVVGGTSASIPLLSTELFDPETNTWSLAGNLTTPRYTHTATRLPDGKVLLMGGTLIWGPGGSMTSKADLYDPNTGTWSNAAPLNTARSGNTATLLPNGKVLIAGGVGPAPVTIPGGNWGYLDSAELYDGGFEIPLLSMDSTAFCVGAPWELTVGRAARSAPVRLVGASNGTSWEIARWGTADAEGNFKATGTMANGTEGAHRLYVDIGGVWSNAVSFGVSDCKP